MKVICIDASNDGGFPGGWMVTEGEIYTVVREIPAKGIDGVVSPCYQLKEDPEGSQWAWDKWQFIPLSQIDETEMIRNYKTQTA